MLTYGSIFTAASFSPRALRSLPIEEVVMPFPSPESTPPVTMTNLVVFTGNDHRASLPSRCRWGDRRFYSRRQRNRESQREGTGTRGGRSDSGAAAQEDRHARIFAVFRKTVFSFSCSSVFSNSCAAERRCFQSRSLRHRCRFA